MYCFLLHTTLDLDPDLDLDLDLTYFDMLEFEIDHRTAFIYGDPETHVNVDATCK